VNGTDKSTIPFALVDSNTKVDGILTILHKLYTSSRFAHENVAHVSLAFLDVRVIRSCDRKIFEMITYWKLTLTGSMIDYDSFVSLRFNTSKPGSIVLSEEHLPFALGTRRCRLNSMKFDVSAISMVISHRSSLLILLLD
jgi:hypothetical protein